MKGIAVRSFCILVVLLMTACNDGPTASFDDAPTSTDIGFGGTFNYECEKYIYSGGDPISGKLNFEEKVNETGTIVLSFDANGEVLFEEKVNNASPLKFKASSYHEADDFIYFSIPENQSLKGGLFLHGTPLSWVDVDGEKKGFAGQFNKNTEEFKIQYSVKYTYENAMGDTVSETRFLKKLSNN